MLVYVARIAYDRSQFVKFDFSVTSISFRKYLFHLDSIFTAERVLSE
jgi:hypothetical protein